MEEDDNYHGEEEQCSCTRSQVQAAQMACSNAAAVSQGFIEIEQRKVGTKALVESKFSGRKMGE